MFARKPDRKVSRYFRAPPVPRVLLVRTVLVGLLAIAGAAWALARHYTHALPSLLTPVPTTAPTYDADAGEFPVPEWFETEPKGR
jgi:hypothetical protein